MDKKNIFIFLLMALPTLLLTSCLKDQEDVFSENASARMQNYLGRVESVLKSSEYGWALNYYPDREDPYGVVYTLKFENDTVQARSLAFDGFSEKDYFTSYYKLTTDDGPVLTFDTYNDILHYYATPWGSSGGYEAYDGDFGFIIMDISDDENTIKLKGKRNGNALTLVRLTKDAQQYLLDTDSISTHIADYSAMIYEDGDFRAKIYYGSESYSIRYTDADGSSTSVSMPYTCTDTGVLFYEPLELNGNTIYGFDYTDGAEAFALNDTKSLIISRSYDAIDLFVAGVWYMDYDNLSEKAKAGWDAFNAGAASLGGLSYAFLGTYAGNFGYYAVVGNRYIGGELFNYTDEGDDTITLSFSGDTYANGTYFRTYCGMSSASEPFYGTFKLTPDNAKNPEKFTLTDINDPENVIVLVAD